MDPKHNHLLAALPDDEWACWQPWLQPVTLAYDQVLFESCDRPSTVLFPTTAVVSLSHMTRDGGSAEFAVVGSDGVVGLSLIMGGMGMPGRAVVLGAGQGYCMDVHRVGAAVERGGPVLNLLLRYTQSLIMQTTQAVVCNRHHSIDQQFSRRLLVGLDRAQADELVMTHEAAANLLGVRREGVTAAALRLQRAGAIRYQRGRIQLLDRQLLEAQACECYSVVNDEQLRLRPTPCRAARPPSGFSTPPKPPTLPPSLPRSLPVRPPMPSMQLQPA